MYPHTELQHINVVTPSFDFLNARITAVSLHSVHDLRTQSTANPLLLDEFK